MHSPIFSLEVFPPKRTSPVGTIYDTLDGLQGLDPDFISVTYGTGKSSDRTLTARIAHTVNEYGIPAVAHLTAPAIRKSTRRRPRLRRISTISRRRSTRA